MSINEPVPRRRPRAPWRFSLMVVVLLACLAALTVVTNAALAPLTESAALVLG